ncbi:MAG: insulinase family protein [Lachnospiraceae bacterium]|nr:insulinase family protein [Lachnospiraceae bacterium]
MKLHDAYELLGQEELTDIHSNGYLLRHKKSGAHIALVENDDENKVFYIGFRTPVNDSTGVPHIIEHTVLCGSDKYPLKDPFVELVKGSLNTFLNAMTYPDKTVFPVASTNDKDFENLMDVYMDAVFHPNIYKHEEIFKQEGWHYEMESEDSDLTLNGVVYNEMKGAFSSPDDVLQREIFNSLFPDTTYHYESGGDPKVIPTLTYEAFLDFHKRYYHPCNSYIYLYGDMDMEERLEYLDQEYLSKYDYFELDSEIQVQKAFEKPLEITKEYSISSGEDTNGQTYLSMNFVVGSVLDQKLYQAFDALDYALINSPGAPVRQALLDAGIGKDITGGYDSGTLQPIFSIVAKGAEESQKDDFIRIIMETLKKMHEGLNHDALRAAINSSEFRYREADFGSYPKGLIYGLNMLDSWLYDRQQPFMHMHAIEVLSELMKQVDSGYFEELVQKYFLENQHVSILVVKPQPGLTSKEDEALKKRLEEYKQTLSEAEIQKIVADTKALREYQQKPETQEDLEKIPLLKRSDLRREVRSLHIHEEKAGDIKVLHHAIETNGIHYLDLVFKISNVTREDIPRLGFLSDIIGLIDTENYGYHDFANEVNIHTGGMNAQLKIYPQRDGEITLTWEARTKFIFENLEKATGLLEEMLFRSDFSNKKRIHDLLKQNISRLELKFQTAGHTAAALRAASYYSPAAALADESSGIAYYQYLKDFENDFDHKVEVFTNRIQVLLKSILRKENLMVDVTGNATALKQVQNYVPSFLGNLYETPVEPCNLVINCTKKNEGFQNAAQIQYVARSGDFKKVGYEYSGVMKVLKVILGYDYFWQKVRVEGGAYGCMSNFVREGRISFVSYRDPNLENTYEVFEKTPEYLRDFHVDERTMTKYIIGTISNMDTPLTPYQKGVRGLTAYMTDISMDMLQKERDQVINVTAEDIRALADVVADTMAQGYLCVIGNEDKIQEQKEMFQEVKPLFA